MHILVKIEAQVCRTSLRLRVRGREAGDMANVAMGAGSILASVLDSCSA